MILNKLKFGSLFLLLAFPLMVSMPLGTAQADDFNVKKMTDKEFQKMASHRIEEFAENLRALEDVIKKDYTKDEKQKEYMAEWKGMRSELSEARKKYGTYVDDKNKRTNEMRKEILTGIEDAREEYWETRNKMRY